MQQMLFQRLLLLATISQIHISSKFLDIQRTLTLADVSKTVLMYRQNAKTTQLLDAFILKQNP